MALARNPRMAALMEPTLTALRIDHLERTRKVASGLATERLREIERLRAEKRFEADNIRLRAALSAAIGYMMNAAIDLETGAPKKTALGTINGGIAKAREALAASV
jgi:hypothetical protein